MTHYQRLKMLNQVEDRNVSKNSFSPGAFYLFSVYQNNIILLSSLATGDVINKGTVLWILLFKKELNCAPYNNKKNIKESST
jgi:hypothetical protein